MLISDEAIVPPEVHAPDSLPDFGQTLFEVLVTEELTHRLGDASLPVSRGLEVHQDAYNLSINHLHRHCTLLTLVAHFTGAAAIGPIIALTSVLWTHLAIAGKGVLRGMLAAAMAIDQVAQQIGVILRSCLAMRQALGPHLLAVVKKLDGDDGLVLPLKPLGRCCMGARAVRVALILLIPNLSEVGAILKHVSHCLFRKGAACFSVKPPLIEHTGNVVIAEFTRCIGLKGHEQSWQFPLIWDEYLLFILGVTKWSLVIVKPLLPALLLAFGCLSRQVPAVPVSYTLHNALDQCAQWPITIFGWLCDGEDFDAIVIA